MKLVTIPQEPGHSGEPRPSRPNTIDRAFWSGIASVVIGFVSLAVVFLSIGDRQLIAAMEQARTEGPAFTPEQLRSIYVATVIGAFVIMAIVAALWIMFLVFMRRGRNWARIVITVVGTLWFLLTLPSVFAPEAGGAATSALAALELVAVAATIVFAYLAPSNEFFAEAHRR